MRPQDVGVQHDLLISCGHLGDVTGSPAFRGMGDYRGAVVWYGKALAIARQTAAADTSNAAAHSDEGIALMRMGISQVAARFWNRCTPRLRRMSPSRRILASFTIFVASP